MGGAWHWFSSDLAPGVVLVAATLVALVVANSPVGAGYEALWSTGLGPRAVGLHLDVPHWINDGLMTLFFFGIGLEIKQELVTGELAHPRRAVVPVLAAVGGAVVPAVVFVALTWGQPAVVGWGIPMATDPAFAVGVLALLARRVPAGCGCCCSCSPPSMTYWQPQCEVNPRRGIGLSTNPFPWVASRTRRASHPGTRLSTSPVEGCCGGSHLVTDHGVGIAAPR
jgi:hypothetical protein